MKTYVFLGAYSEVPDARIKLTRYGQRVELSEELAESIKHPRGLLCIPAEDFDKIGFTADELRKYAIVDSHASAPADFLLKKKQALDILHSIRGEE